jgi:predicted PurR-regulated permease PerM
MIRDIILSVFVALLIMVILNPLVRKLSKFKIPRGASVLIVYFTFFGLVIFSLASVVPALVEQTSNFANGLPGYVQNIKIPSAIGDQITRDLGAFVGMIPGRVVGVSVSIVSNFVAVLTVLTFAFYLLMARDKLDDQLAFFFGKTRSQEIGEIIDELEVKLGGWARGQLLLMFTVGFFNYVGLTILGIPYALPLGIFAGIMEAVPYIGPILGAVPGVVIGFGISPIMGIGTAALAFLIQQVENYVLVPKIMEKSVGVAPIVTLVALAIGFRVAGIPGILISVPVVITLQVFGKRHFKL